MGDALRGHAALGALLDGWRVSQECMQAARPILGQGLEASLRPGQLQDGQWVLLAANGPAAAKARQLLPRINEALRMRGLGVDSVKIKVSPRN